MLSPYPTLDYFSYYIPYVCMQYTRQYKLVHHFFFLQRSSGWFGLSYHDQILKLDFPRRCEQGAGGGHVIGVEWWKVRVRGAPAPAGAGTFSTCIKSDTARRTAQKQCPQRC